MFTFCLATLMHLERTKNVDTTWKRRTIIQKMSLLVSFFEMAYEMFECQSRDNRTLGCYSIQRSKRILSDTKK